MAKYNELIVDLEMALRTQEQMSAGYRDRIESLETALNLERTFSEQRNRINGELGISLTAITAERDELRLNAQRYTILRTYTTPREFYDKLIWHGKSPGAWQDLPTNQSIVRKIDELCDAVLVSSAQQETL